MMKFIKNKGVILLLILFGILVVGQRVLALELIWPTSPGGTQLTDATTLTEMVKYFYDWGIALGGLAAFIALVLAGFQYLTSVGDPTKIKDAKDRINSAVLGLLLLLSSFLVLNVINPELTTLKTPSLKGSFLETCKDLEECKKQNPNDWLTQCKTQYKDCTGMDPEEPEDITKPCEKAIIYSQPNYDTELVTIENGHQENVTIETDLGSIKVYGNCAVELYRYFDCKELMATLSFDNPNLSTLYIRYNIQCIKVKEL